MILSTNLIEYCELFLKLLEIRSIESSNVPTLWDIIDEQSDTERLLEAMDKVWKLLNLEEIDFCENFAKIIKNNSITLFSSSRKDFRLKFYENNSLIRHSFKFLSVAYRQRSSNT